MIISIPTAAPEVAGPPRATANELIAAEDAYNDALYELQKCESDLNKFIEYRELLSNELIIVPFGGEEIVPGGKPVLILEQHELAEILGRLVPTGMMTQREAMIYVKWAVDLTKRERNRIDGLIQGKTTNCASKQRVAAAAEARLNALRRTLGSLKAMGKYPLIAEANTSGIGYDGISKLSQCQFSVNKTVCTVTGNDNKKCAFTFTYSGVDASEIFPDNRFRFKISGNYRCNFPITEEEKPNAGYSAYLHKLGGFLAHDSLGNHLPGWGSQWSCGIFIGTSGNGQASEPDQETF